MRDIRSSLPKHKERPPSTDGVQAFADFLGGGNCEVI